jgi:hypothetical protein
MLSWKEAEWPTIQYPDIFPPCKIHVINKIGILFTIVQGSFLSACYRIFLKLKLSLAPSFQLVI